MKETNVVYAGFWIRFFAFVIDSLLVIMILSPLGSMYGGDTQIEYDALMHAIEHQDTYALTILLRDIQHTTLSEWGFWLSLLLPAIAVITFWIYKSTTPGKMILKIKIVDAESGENLSKGQCIGRYFGYYLSGVPLFIGFLAIAANKRKQGWHDKLAGTIVIKVDKTANQAHS